MMIHDFPVSLLQTRLGCITKRRGDVVCATEQALDGSHICYLHLRRANGCIASRRSIQGRRIVSRQTPVAVNIPCGGYSVVRVVYGMTETTCWALLRDRRLPWAPVLALTFPSPTRKLVISQMMALR